MSDGQLASAFLIQKTKTASSRVIDLEALLPELSARLKKRGVTKQMVYGDYIRQCPEVDKHSAFLVRLNAYMRINPNGLNDDNGIDYAEQTKNYKLINRAYCIDNPKKYKGYGADCWGLTAGDSCKGSPLATGRSWSDTANRSIIFFSIHSGV